MKLHRHTSHENDEMRTHEWPQFVQDDIEYDDIYVMNGIHMYTLQKQLKTKKTKNA